MEILLPQSRITISQIADPTQQPRSVNFRENARLFNSPLLPFDELKNDRQITGRPSFLMIHGHQELTFLHIAMPHAVRRRAYICKTANLLSLPHEIVQPGPPAEDTSFRDTMTLKDQISRWLRDHGG